MKKDVYERGEILENNNNQRSLIIGRSKYGYSVLAITEFNSNQDIPDLKTEFGEILLGGMFLKNSVLSEYYSLIGRLNKADYLKIININSDYQKGLIDLENGVLRYLDWGEQNVSSQPKYRTTTAYRKTYTSLPSVKQEVHDDTSDIDSSNTEKSYSNIEKIENVSEETKIDTSVTVSTKISTKVNASTIKLVDSMPKDNTSVKMYYNEEETLNIASMSVKAIMQKYGVKNFTAMQMHNNARSYCGVKTTKVKKNDFISFFKTGGDIEDWLNANKNADPATIYSAKRSYKNFIKKESSIKIEGSSIENVLDNLPLKDIAALCGLISDKEEAKAREIYKSQIPATIDFKTKDNMDFINLCYLSKSIYYQAGIDPAIAFEPVETIISHYDTKSKLNSIIRELIKFLSELNPYYIKYWDRHVDISNKVLTIPELDDSQMHALWYLVSSRYTNKMPFEGSPKEKDLLTCNGTTVEAVLYFGITPEKFSRRKTSYAARFLKS